MPQRPREKSGAPVSSCRPAVNSPRRRRISSGPVTIAYARYSITMQVVPMARKASGEAKLSSSSAAARTPTTRAGALGMPVRGLTCARRPENGSSPSRAMENSIRQAAVWIARVATAIATTTSASSTLPTPSPRLLVRT